MNADQSDYAYQIESEADYNEVAADLANDLMTENSSEQIALIAAQHIIYADTLRVSLEESRKRAAALGELLEKNKGHDGNRSGLLLAMCKSLVLRLQKHEPPACPKLPPTKRELVKAAVDKIEQWHVAPQAEFDRRDMPGDAGDLLWLMSKLHPKKFDGMCIKAFRPHYRGICQWSRAAGSQAGAKSLYLEIFPELKHNSAPVVKKTSGN